MRSTILTDSVRIPIIIHIGSQFIITTPLFLLPLNKSMPVVFVSKLII